MTVDRVWGVIFLWISFCYYFLIFFHGINGTFHVCIFCCVHVCIVFSIECELGYQTLYALLFFDGSGVADSLPSTIGTDFLGHFLVPGVCRSQGGPIFVDHQYPRYGFLVLVSYVGMYYILAM